MKKHKLFICGVLGLCAWFILVPGSSQVYGSEISPVESPNSDLVTLSIINPETGQDMTETWLPVPGQVVHIRVNGVSGGSFVLVPPVEGNRLTTSAYPGTCTNYSDPNQPDFDFDEPQLDVDSGHWQLIPRDSGGRAVIRINDTYTFVLPPDNDEDDMADYWEQKNCIGGHCPAEQDSDTGFDADSSIGDGVAAFDEYRGFRISGEFKRTDPKVKDFFIHLEEGQCYSAGVDLKTFFPTYDPEVIDFGRLFANMNSLIPDIQIHHINSDEWIDHFESYSANTGVEYSADGDELTDRQISTYAINPLGNLPAKGVRLIECLDTIRPSPLGLSNKTSPDGVNRNDGNAVIFTRRIWEYYQELFELGGERQLRYLTFENGDWVVKASFPSEGRAEGEQEIMRYALAFYAGHETAGHSLDLTSTLEGTKKVAYGYHHADGTGTNIDIRIVHQVDRKEDAYNNFYIPFSFGNSDKRDMRLLSNQ